MEYGLALLAGITHKYTDDLLDTKQTVANFHLELAKVVMVSIITLALFKNASLLFLFIRSLGTNVY